MKSLAAGVSIAFLSGMNSSTIRSIYAKLSEIDLGCVDLIDLFRVGSKDQSLH